MCVHSSHGLAKWCHCPAGLLAPQLNEWSSQEWPINERILEAAKQERWPLLSSMCVQIENIVHTGVQRVIDEA